MFHPHDRWRQRSTCIVQADFTAYYSDSQQCNILSNEHCILLISIFYIVTIQPPAATINTWLIGWLYKQQPLIWSQPKVIKVDSTKHLDIQGNPVGCQELLSSVRRWEPCGREVAGMQAAGQWQPTCYWLWSGVHLTQMAPAPHLYYQKVCK